jgi:hypothetical protein
MGEYRMPFEVGSQSLGIASELIVVMPIRKGFVETRSTVSYATRIRLILKTLHAVRKIAVEASAVGTIAGPLERLQIIDVVRWSILENDTKLMMAVSFKGAWEPYIRKIQLQAGKILDAVLCNCDGYAALHRSELGFPAFAEWVRKNQIRCEQYYSATPDTTIDDLQYLKELATEQRNRGADAGFDLRATRQTVKTPDVLAAVLAEADIALYQRQWLQILVAFFGLAKYFADSDGKFLRNLTRSVMGSAEPKYPLMPAQEKLYELPLGWIRTTGDFNPPQPVDAQLPRDIADIQGGILRTYEKITPQGAESPTHGVLLLLRFVSAAAGRIFLATISGDVTREDASGATISINIALTFEGLKHLDLPPQDIAKLPREFRDGMESRAGLLGDVRANHPRNWNLPRRLKAAATDAIQHVPLSTVDCVIQLQTVFDANPDQHLQWLPDHPLHGTADTLLANAQRANGGEATVELLAAQVLRRTIKNDDGKYVGHFGFVDGISQPRFCASAAEPDYAGNQVPLGELLLGYKNTHGDAADSSELFFNSTFLALRKLRQDVGAFNQFVGKASASAAIGPDLLKAKMAGRYPDGTTLLPAMSSNDFDFTQDRGGEQCPLHAHIRRSNPRIPGTPHIIRRGFSYGSRYQDQPLENDRGLFFMAFNASLADQFEVIQQWISGGNSAGSLSAESDPLLGVAEYGKPRTLRYIHNGRVERSDMNAPGPQTQFVTLEWGMYLFVPSLRALKYLAALPPASANAASSQELELKARDAIEKLLLAEKLHACPELAHASPDTTDNWKALLEDLSVRESGLTDAIWKVIRERYHGVLRTAYGVLIGNDAQVMQIFRDRGKQYSVREYWWRMRQSIGEGFLGMDPQPTALGSDATDAARRADEEYRNAVPSGRYAQESSDANAAVAAVSEKDAFELTLPLARKLVSDLRAAQQKVSGRFVLPIELLCELTLAQLSTRWFGIPDGGLIKSGAKVSADLYCPSDFISVGSYVFNPRPTDFVASFGKVVGLALHKSIEEFLKQLDASKNQAPILQALQRTITDKSRLASTLAGLIQGFVTPTFGSTLSMMGTLIDNKQLWHLQLDWAHAKPADDKAFDVAKKILRNPMIDAMRVQPVPGLLHRVAVDTHDIHGKKINAGQKIVLGLVSATREKPSGSPTEIIFGGDYDAQAEKKTTHACPGKDMALGVMLGFLIAVVEAGEISVEAPLMLNIR